jgi:hypothetical protein
VADFAIRWDKFDGGDFGRRSPARAQNDEFRGRNVVVYPSGLIGPRAGWKEITVSGLPAHTVTNGPMGFEVFHDHLVVVVGKPYRFPMTDPSTAVAYDDYTNPAATPVEFTRGNDILYSLVDGKLFKHDVSTTTEITTPVPFSHIVRWGLWMVAVDRDNPWRIYYNQVDASGPDYDTWPANNFYDVGNTDAITCLRPVYNTLYAGKLAGWWAISGVLGDLVSIRQVVIGNGPVDRRYTSVTTDNRIVYWPAERIPAWFNGERVYLDSDQRLDPRGLPYQSQVVLVTPTGRRLIMCGDDDSLDEGTDMLVWHKSAWTRHLTPFNVGAIAPTDVQAASEMPDGVIFAVERASTVGEDVNVLSWDHDLDRPAHVNDQWASPVDYKGGDLIAGTLDLPSWFDGQGRQCRVRSVIVQFRKYASGVAGSVNQLRCTVDALGPYAGGKNVLTPSGWQEPSDLSTTDGLADSWRANFGNQGFGNGFQIKFPVIRGIAIQEVVALVDIRSERV